jgi:hypothetical protein
VTIFILFFIHVAVWTELQPNRPLDTDIADDRRSVASDDRAEHSERQELRFVVQLDISRQVSHC